MPRPSAPIAVSFAVVVVAAACSTSTDDGASGSGGPAGVAFVSPSCDAPPAPGPSWTVSDGVCRSLADAGVTLVDWDGHIGNPAIALTLTPPAGAAFPVDVTISADDPRIYFDARPERKRGESYPPVVRKLTFADATPQGFRVAIWPDRDGDAEEHVLQVAGGGVTTKLDVHVVDQDLGTPIRYPLVVDFSKDAAFPDGSHFFDDQAKRALVTQAADDWAYFFDGGGLDPVAAGAETTTVDDATGWYGPRPKQTNAAGYTGYLLYGTGIHTTEDRSTGYPTPFQAFESVGGSAIAGSLHRSGALEIERLGNYNELGWFVSTDDEDWYRWDNLADVANDLASIAHHEIGHALFFDVGYERFIAGAQAASGAITYGALASPEITAYYGAEIPYPGDPSPQPGLRIDERSHFSTGTDPNKGLVVGAIDPASGLGAFGNEYADTGVMPRRRWIITKLDLLAAKAIGYPLREATSPFVPLALADGALPDAARGAAYTASLAATGGVPSYAFLVTGGSFPPGLALDSFTGALSGTPTTSATYAFTVTLKDALGAATDPKNVQIVVR